jgi:prophage regulatory protein
MSTQMPEFFFKAEVAQCLSLSERAIEKLVKDGKFPPPLRLGKHAVWSKPVVCRWLESSLQPQQDWEPRRKRGRPATTARSAPTIPSA